MRKIRDILYMMGLIETLCFIATNDEDWWFTKNDMLMLLHMHGLFSERCKIVSSNLMGPNKYK